jgi:phage tail tape-measure protein
MFASKIEDPVTKEVKYAPIAKLLEDRKFAKRLENNLGKTGVKKLEDFAEAARAMAVAEKNIPNPSGTAIVESVKKWITGIGSALVGQASLPTLAVSGASAYGLTQLLTHKRFLNKALQFAKEPTEPLAKQLERIVKENTGLTIQALSKAREEISE